MGKKKYNFTKEDLIHHYESGMLMKQVAELYNINKETLRKIHIKLGINIKDFKNAGKFRNLTKEELIEHYKNGDSINELSRIYGVSAELVRDKNKEFCINISDYYDYRHDYDVHIFSKIDTEEKAYWLGFLYADGNVRKEPHNSTISLHLSEVDLDHIKKFKSFMKDTRSDDVIKHQQREKSSGGIQYMVYYQVCSGFLKDDLIKLGCVPAKSLILTFPNKDIFETDELVYDFIRGYVDGDGCLTKTSRDNRLGISIRGTLNMLEGIRSYFPEFAKVYSEVDKRTTKTQYKLYWCSDKADLVAQKLYGKATIYLDRKYDKYAALCKLYSEKSGNIGEGCDANTEITDEMSKGLSVL